MAIANDLGSHYGFGKKAREPEKIGFAGGSLALGLEPSIHRGLGLERGTWPAPTAAPVRGAAGARVPPRLLGGNPAALPGTGRGSPLPPPLRPRDRVRWVSRARAGVRRKRDQVLIFAADVHGGLRCSTGGGGLFIYFCKTFRTSFGSELQKCHCPV